MPDKHEVGGSSPLGPTSVERHKGTLTRCFRAADKPRVRSVTRVNGLPKDINEMIMLEDVLLTAKKREGKCSLKTE